MGVETREQNDLIIERVSGDDGCIDGKDKGKLHGHVYSSWHFT